MIKKYSQLSANEVADAFFKKYNIDPEEMNFLGKGHFGTAYSVGDGRVLKITSSESEYQIASELLNKPQENLVKIYAVEKAVESPLRGYYYILQEELEQFSEDESLFYEVVNMLDTQGLPVSYISHFDEEEYEAENGVLSFEIKTYLQELSEVIFDARRFTGDTMDISADNLGRDKNGVLKAFDLDEKR
jgi:hypothetical protein